MQAPLASSAAESIAATARRLIGLHGCRWQDNDIENNTATGYLILANGAVNGNVIKGNQAAGGIFVGSDASNNTIESNDATTDSIAIQARALLPASHPPSGVPQFTASGDRWRRPSDCR